MKDVLFLEAGILIAIGSMSSRSLMNESNGMPGPVSQNSPKLMNSTRHTTSGNDLNSLLSPLLQARTAMLSLVLATPYGLRQPIGSRAREVA